MRKDQNDCFQRLFKYPPIESPVTLIKLANQIKDLLFKCKRKKELKNNSSASIKKDTNILGNNNKPKSTMSEFLKTNSESNNFITTNPKIPKKSPSSSTEDTNNNVSPINQQKINSVLSVPSTYINNSNGEDESTKILLRLEEIYKKYKNIFDQDDSSDFESIIETLKNNLNSSD